MFPYTSLPVAIFFSKGTQTGKKFGSERQTLLSEAVLSCHRAIPSVIDCLTILPYMFIPARLFLSLEKQICVREMIQPVEGGLYELVIG